MDADRENIVHVWGQGIFGNSLYFTCNFAVNLKQFSIFIIIIIIFSNSFLKNNV